MIYANHRKIYTSTICYEIHNKRFTYEGLSNVEKIYRKILNKKEKLKRETITVIIDKTKKLNGKFYGISHKNGTKSIFKYYQDEYTYNCTPVITENEVIMTTPREEIPTLINKIENSKDKKLLLERWKNQIEAIPYRQDLFDLLQIYNHKIYRYNKILHICRAIFIQFVNDMFPKFSIDEIQIIRLIINNYEYLFQHNRRSETKLIADLSNPVKEKIIIN